MQTGVANPPKGDHSVTPSMIVRGGIAAPAFYAENEAVADPFDGDRTGTLRDPFGHRWMLATHVEHVSAEEGPRRTEAELARAPQA